MSLQQNFKHNGMRRTAAVGNAVVLAAFEALWMTQGMESYCVRAFAEAMEVVPYTLAENAGLNPIQIVTELRNKHAAGEKYAGINVRKNSISDMLVENVVQPLLVTTSALTLACECVRMILKVGPCHTHSCFLSNSLLHIVTLSSNPLPCHILHTVPCLALHSMSPVPWCM